MKKNAAIALALILTISLTACGRRNNSKATTPTKESTPITVPTVPEATIPTSNIPDPSVESNSTMSTETTSTETTSITATE